MTATPSITVKASSWWKMFKKILVANRGEIALRVVRAARDMGIRTVAVFSEADRDSAHVRLADQAFCIGPGPVSRSYLNIANIISAAVISGADAIHPGYGFLAENARFAEICADYEITFIGPSASVIAKMGDKAMARRVMAEANVPTTPGSDILDSLGAAEAAAEQIGYPVLLKAAAGGGGKGMRAVERAEELPLAYRTAQAEAEANFKDGRLYLERLVAHPRHIEVQVFGDAFGRVVHLGERDCSVQKPSHQKLIEEAPASRLSGSLRSRLHETAVAAARAVSYTNAGTIEFLVSEDEFYFMEMNTRIQVEHAVTEMAYGVDLVAEQIRVAAGEPLSFTPEQLRPKAHAIEVRINAEDAGRNFAPAAGTLARVVFPGGPGVRIDSHVAAGDAVPPYYDSLIAKIIVAGAGREEAILRMQRALAETEIEGVETTIAICSEVLADPLFAAGALPVEYLHRLSAIAA